MESKKGKMMSDEKWEISDALQTLQDGESAILGPVPDDDEGLALFPMNLERLNDILGQPKFIFAFCMMMRPGNALFQRYLELKYFHPESADNDLMLCIFHKWQGLLWSLTGVPRAWADGDDIHNGEAYMREAIEYAGLRVVDEGFVPMMIGGEGEPNTDFAGVPVHMPLFNMTNVIYLENGKDHLIYTDKQAAEDEQSKKIQELEEQYL